MKKGSPPCTVRGVNVTKDQALSCTILRCHAGSRLHGVHIEGEDDQDEMGVMLEPLEKVAGFDDFEQFIYRDAAEREGKIDAPSKPGDLDLTIFGLRKFLRLALQGNPAQLQVLYTPPRLCLSRDARGGQLQALIPLIVSRQAGRRYLGWIRDERKNLITRKTGRNDLVTKYGHDVKSAAQLLRLSIQGVELLSTGHLTLPMLDKDRYFVRAVRKGQADLVTLLPTIASYEAQLVDLLRTSPLREYPAVSKVEEWMTHCYLEQWRGQHPTVGGTGILPAQWGGECHAHPNVSRTCERGTIHCVVYHQPTVDLITKADLQATGDEVI